jgi:hypothetical protein
MDKYQKIKERTKWRLKSCEMEEGLQGAQILGFGSIYTIVRDEPLTHSVYRTVQ